MNALGEMDGKIKGFKTKSLLTKQVERSLGHVERVAPTVHHLVVRAVQSMVQGPIDGDTRAVVYEVPAREIVSSSYSTTKLEMQVLSR